MVGIHEEEPTDRKPATRLARSTNGLHESFPSPPTCRDRQTRLSIRLASQVVADASACRGDRSVHGDGSRTATRNPKQTVFGWSPTRRCWTTT